MAKAFTNPNGKRAQISPPQTTAIVFVETSNWEQLMRLLLPVLLLMATTSLVKSDTLPTAQTPPLAGELQLEGKIEQIEEGRVTISATAFTNQSGKRGTIAPPKTKIILLPPTGAPANWKMGQTIIVTGRDEGSGKPLVAREVVLLPQDTESTPPTPPAIPNTQPKPQTEQVRPPAGPKVLEFRAGLTPGWKAGNLNVRIEKAGFDYPTRFLPSNFSALEQTPVFYTIFQIRGQLPPGDIRERLNIRRLLGPRSEFIRPVGIDFTRLPSEGDAARVVLWDSKVDPSWEFVDMDVDTVFGDPSVGKAQTELVLENIPFPKQGEVPVKGEVTSTLGTRYQAVKIKAIGNSQWKLVISHQLPAEPRDVEISGYTYQSSNGAGSGGLMNGKANQGEDEIFLSSSQAETQIKRIAIRFREASNSTQKRDGVSRQRVRFPLRDLLQQSPPQPLDKPLPVLAQTTTGLIEARVESQGLTWGNDGVGAIVFLRGTPDDIKRGIQWTIQKGSLRVPGDPTPRNVPALNTQFSYLWHVDTTPKADEESVGLVMFKAGAGVTRGDAELELEGRAQFSTPFEKTITIPLANGAIPIEDKDDEATLILRKVQKFSRPDELEHPDWFRGDWPNGGIALIFETNPLMGDADFTPRCFDAEDDQGRPLQRGVAYQETVRKIDVTTQQQSPLYTLVIGQPAPDAKFIKIWLTTEEKSRTVRKQTIQLKDIILDKTK